MTSRKQWSATKTTSTACTTTNHLTEIYEHTFDSVFLQPVNYLSKTRSANPKVGWFVGSLVVGFTYLNVRIKFSYVCAFRKTLCIAKLSYHKCLSCSSLSDHDNDDDIFSFFTTKDVDYQYSCNTLMLRCKNLTFLHVLE